MNRKRRLLRMTQEMYLQISTIFYRFNKTFPQTNTFFQFVSMISALKELKIFNFTLHPKWHCDTFLDRYSNPSNNGLLGISESFPLISMTNHSVTNVLLTHELKMQTVTNGTGKTYVVPEDFDCQHRISKLAHLEIFFNMLAAQNILQNNMFSFFNLSLGFSHTTEEFGTFQLYT